MSATTLGQTVSLLAALVGLRRAPAETRLQRLDRCIEDAMHFHHVAERRLAHGNLDHAVEGLLEAAGCYSFAADIAEELGRAQEADLYGAYHHRLTQRARKLATH